MKFTNPSLVMRRDHTGRGIQQGPEHGCPASAQAAGELLKAKDTTSALNPRPWWYVASKQDNGTWVITSI